MVSFSLYTGMTIESIGLVKFSNYNASHVFFTVFHQALLLCPETSVWHRIAEPVSLLLHCPCLYWRYKQVDRLSAQISTPRMAQSLNKTGISRRGFASM